MRDLRPPIVAHVHNPPPPLSKPPPVRHPAVAYIDDPTVVLHVGFEGREIQLIAKELTAGWSYRYSSLNQTYTYLDESDGEFAPHFATCAARSTD